MGNADDVLLLGIEPFIHELLRHVVSLPCFSVDYSEHRPRKRRKLLEKGMTMMVFAETLASRGRIMLAERNFLYCQLLSFDERFYTILPHAWYITNKINRI